MTRLKKLSILLVGLFFFGAVLFIALRPRTFEMESSDDSCSHVSYRLCYDLFSMQWVSAGTQLEYDDQGKVLRAANMINVPYKSELWDLYLLAGTTNKTLKTILDEFRYRGFLVLPEDKSATRELDDESDR